jgi:hypothetical protein
MELVSMPLLREALQLQMKYAAIHCQQRADSATWIDGTSEKPTSSVS